MKKKSWIPECLLLLTVEFVMMFVAFMFFLLAIKKQEVIPVFIFAGFIAFVSVEMMRTFGLLFQFRQERINEKNRTPIRPVPSDTSII